MPHRKHPAACYIAAVVTEGLRDGGSRGLDAVLPVLMYGLDRLLDRGEMHVASDIGNEGRFVDRCDAGAATRVLQSTCRCWFRGAGSARWFRGSEMAATRMRFGCKGIEGIAEACMAAVYLSKCGVHVGTCIRLI
jgi:hypothetical protein